MKIHSCDHLIEHYESCPHFQKKWAMLCNCDAWGRAALKMIEMLNDLEEKLEHAKELNKTYDQEVKRLFAENHAKDLECERNVRFVTFMKERN